MKKSASGMLVTAAFVGPGTVTTASIAGAQFGFGLLWALLLSVAITIVLQEMAARLAIVSGKGLANAIVDSIRYPPIRYLVAVLILAAIAIGNAAYQAGNLTGAALGLSQLGYFSIGQWSMLLGAFAWSLLWFGRIQLVQNLLFGLVALMAVLFCLTLLLLDIPWLAVFEGLQPSINPANGLLVIALIGTTVVPYNLFLQAGLLADPESKALDAHDNGHRLRLSAFRWQNAMAIVLGGILTGAIMLCSAIVLYPFDGTPSPMLIASQLEPLLGRYASVLFALGMLSAGLTSALTAPLAAALVVCGLIGQKAENHNRYYRLSWGLVLAAGILFCSMEIKPLLLILFAQATNGLLLPLVAVFLLWVVNQNHLMGRHRNGWLGNSIATIAVLTVSLLAGYKLFSLGLG